MTIFGCDLSHYDWTRGPVDVAAMHTAGIQFMTHKLGGDAPDPRFGDWWARARPLRATMLPGAYWVLYPGRPAARADEFVADLDDRAPGWRDSPFILQPDCERWRNDPRTVPSPADIGAFCDRLRVRAPEYRPMAYAPEWVYGDRLRGLACPLWASAYGGNLPGPFRSLYPGDASIRWDAYSGQVPAILQYSSKATIGGQPTCDANAFRGSLAELAALVTGETVITKEDAKQVAAEVWAYVLRNAYSGADQAAGTMLRYIPSRAPHEVTQSKVDALAHALASVASGAITDADIAALQASIGQAGEQMPARVLAAMQPALAGLPQAIVAELGAHDGPDGAVIEAAVRRALAGLRLAAVDTPTA